MRTKNLSVWAFVRSATVGLSMVAAVTVLMCGRTLAQGDASQEKVLSRKSETNGYNQDLYAVQGAKVKPGGTADDPENLAGQGYNQHAIRNIYKMRSIAAYCNEAQALKKSGDLDGALALYLKTLQLNKESNSGNEQPILAGLGDVYVAKGQYSNAIKAYHDFVYEGGRPGGQDEILAKYAILLHDAGQYDEALQMYNLALAHRPLENDDPLKKLVLDGTNGNTSLLPFGANLILAKDGMGGDYYYDGRREAVAYARAAVKLRPNMAVGHCYLGLALQALTQEVDLTAADRAAAAEESAAEFDKAFNSGSTAVKIFVDRQHGR